MPTAATAAGFCRRPRWPPARVLVPARIRGVAPPVGAKGPRGSSHKRDGCGCQAALLTPALRAGVPRERREPAKEDRSTIANESLNSLPVVSPASLRGVLSEKHGGPRKEWPPCSNAW